MVVSQNGVRLKLEDPSDCKQAREAAVPPRHNTVTTTEPEEAWNLGMVKKLSSGGTKLSTNRSESNRATNLPHIPCETFRNSEQFGASAATILSKRINNN